MVILGFTHYWNNGFEITDAEWQSVELGVTPILVEHKDIICSEYDKPEESFYIDHEKIVFNGKGEDGHETFVFSKKPQGRDGFAFCKTARKPYDIVVCKVLLVLYTIFGDKLDLGSDGFPSDENWEKAFRWISKKVNKKIRYSSKDEKVITTNLVIKPIQKSIDPLETKIRKLYKSQNKKTLIDILIKLVNENQNIKDEYKKALGVL